jgi:4-diphosphocytidyl-2-C-methyl-D-erythritol kinase
MMRVDAYAKVTLSLRVLGRRSDGYHDIDAFMVTVTEPHDTLEIEPVASTSLTVVGPFAAGVPLDASNLVWRALDALGVHARVRLHKGIPHGAGLGGGSADAAAVLRAFDAAPSIGVTLGADVPFCVRAGAARVRGIGDAIESVAIASTSLVIATPRFSCATADVYRAWDDLGGPHVGVNELEVAAQHVEPRLRSFGEAVEAAAGRPVILAGSGSSYVVVCDDERDARLARDRVQVAVDGWVWLAAAPAVPPAMPVGGFGLAP